MKQIIINKLNQAGYEQKTETIFEKNAKIESVKTVMCGDYVKTSPIIEIIKINLTLLGDGGEMRGDDIIKPYEFISIKTYSKGMLCFENSIGLSEEDVNDMESFLQNLEDMLVR